MKRVTLVGAGLLGGVLLGVLLTHQPFLQGQFIPAQPAKEKEKEKEKEKRVIHASGSANVRVSPDSARLFFSVQTMQPKLASARAENAQLTQKVIDAVRKLQIPKLKMKSSDVNVSIRYSDTTRAERLPIILGYLVTNSFTILVENDDPTKLAEAATRILDTALETGVNQVPQLTFFRKDLKGTQRRAMEEAVQDALQNARTLARGAEVRITDTVEINESSPVYYGAINSLQNAMMPVGGEGGTATPLVAGDLDVTMRVSITCTY
jgi:uncharacterized protein YggE